MHAYYGSDRFFCFSFRLLLARVSLPGPRRARHLPGRNAARSRHEKFRLPVRPTPLPSFRGGRSLTNCRYTYRPTSQPAERSVALPSFTFKGTHSVACLSLPPPSPSPLLSPLLSLVSFLCPALSLFLFCSFRSSVSPPRVLQGVSQSGKRGFVAPLQKYVEFLGLNRSRC